MRTDEKHSQAPGLTAAQRQRAVGAVVAAATGDALGAPYEFQAPVVDSEEIDMIGGGVLGWQPGEWTDDTSVAIVVLEATLAASDHLTYGSVGSGPHRPRWYCGRRWAPDA